MKPPTRSYRGEVLELPVSCPKPRQRGARLVPQRRLPHRRHHLQPADLLLCMLSLCKRRIAKPKQLHCQSFNMVAMLDACRFSMTQRAGRLRCKNSRGERTRKTTQTGTSMSSNRSVMLMSITAARLICSLGVGISLLGNLRRVMIGLITRTASTVLYQPA